MGALLYSADSHVFEPQDLWTRRIASAFRDRAPKIVRKPETGDWLVADGVPPIAVALSIQAGRDIDKRSQYGLYEEARPSGWDPAARLADQDLDGVGAEVLYPSNALFLYSAPDISYQRACFDAYNEWLAEFVSYAPSRLIGVGLVSVVEVAEAVRQVERVAKLGLRGVMIQGENPAVHYGDRRYDPLWAACQDNGLPVTMHGLTYGPGNRTAPPEEYGLAGYIGVPYMVEYSLATLLLFGVFERFPKLSVVSAENDIGWIAHFLARLDHAYTTHRAWSGQQRLSLLPSEFFKRQVWATFMDDPVGIFTRSFYSVDRIMWASDFPHSDSTWPKSLEIAARNLEGTTDAERAKVTRDNVRALYRIT